MRPKLNFSPAQVRAGRALCDLSAAQLADMAGLEAEAVELFESGQGELSPSEHEAMCRALYAEGAGVIAIPAQLGGEGVRFARAFTLNPMLIHLASRMAPTAPTRRRGNGDW